MSFGLCCNAYVSLWIKSVDTDFILVKIAERGAEYEFRIAARNSVDFGEYATEVIKTPDGRKYDGFLLFFYVMWCCILP